MLSVCHYFRLRHLYSQYLKYFPYSLAWVDLLIRKYIWFVYFKFYIQIKKFFFLNGMLKWVPFHSEIPRAMKGYSKNLLPVHRGANQKSWMTSSLFPNWVLTCAIPDIEIICDSWDEVKPSCMNGVWRKIWPECTVCFLKVWRKLDVALLTLSPNFGSRFQ